MRRSGLVAVVFVVLAMTGTMGCKKIKQMMFEKAVDTASGGKVQVDNGTGALTFNVDGGAVTFGEQKVPATWPKTVPVYPSLTIVSSVVTTADPKRNTDAGLMILGNTPDSLEKVVAFYEANLTGFKKLNDVSAQGGRQIQWQDAAGNEIVDFKAAGDAKTGTQVWLVTGKKLKK